MKLSTKNLLASALPLLIGLLLGGFALPANAASAPEALPAGALTHSASLYLRDAASDKIRWQPWGDASFALARKLNRPVMIDIGAVWCHWCHVIDNTTYTDPEVVRILNARFVPIKVDSDERPDVDSYYQAAAANLTGAGGWPLVCFVTPDGALMYAAGYLPAEPKGAGSAASAAMIPLLQRIATAWATDKRELSGQADALALKLAAEAHSLPASSSRGDSQALRAQILAGLKSSYDPEGGGFGSGPGPRFYDFPALRLALAYGFFQHPEYRRIATDSLIKISRGGVFDQLGGGFHRYSTDPRWRVPHFEKMAYDQAMALTTYTEAYQLTRDPRLLAVIRQTIGYVNGTLLGSDRLAFSAHQDADSFKGDDGSYYTWTLDEVKHALPADRARAAILFYGMDAASPPRAPDGRIVLAQALTPEALADKLKISPAAARAILVKANQGLLAARNRRRTPPVDHVVMTDRNALMASAFLTVAEATGDDRCEKTALGDLDFILGHLRAPDGSFYHEFSEGNAAVRGIAADQVYLAAALLDAFQATGNAKYLTEARALAGIVIAKFRDPQTGLIRNVSAGPKDNVLAAPAASPQVMYDTPMPSVQGQAAIVMRMLGEITSDAQYTKRSDELLAPASVLAGGNADSTLGTVGLALEAAADGGATIAIVGPQGDAKTAALLAAAFAAYRPAKIVVRVDPAHAKSGAMPTAAQAMYAAAGRHDAPLAFVCAGTACARPVSDPHALAQVIATFMAGAASSASTPARKPRTEPSSEPSFKVQL
ncbi:MAG: thioredoxin domain-containing protein [Candidatus Binataceae bacterium]